MTPFKIVEDFEKALCEYTGAPYAVAVSSCTDALGICFEHLYNEEYKHNSTPEITLPKHTYIGVPMQAKRAGFDIEFVDEKWVGRYSIWPYDLWDCARSFHKGMYTYHHHDTYACVSFHASKILGYTHGGAILHNNPYFDNWARQARFDGRTFDGSTPTVLGRHANMTPDVAAALLYKLYHLPAHNEDLPNSDYPDLSTMEIFK